MSRQIKIVLAEDHGALRQGYIELFKRYGKFTVVLDVGDGLELLEKLKTVRADILLLDLVMPTGPSGIELLKILRTKYPTLRVIVVSGHFTPENVVECFKLGVKAFSPKTFKIEKIAEVIDTVIEKGRYVDEEVALMLAEELNHSGSRQKAELDLTDRQYEVLKLICSGHTNKTAAKALKLSVGVIKHHRANIMQRTRSANFKELMLFALKHKLLD